MRATFHDAADVKIVSIEERCNCDPKNISRTKSPGIRLRNNESPRYHYLYFPEEFPIPASVIDFKHYFSVNVEHLKGKKRDCFSGKVAELFREDISQRFASYLSRIALP